jgi:hypothetical protein
MTMTSRETHIYMARVHLLHARASRHHPMWHATLLKWAARRRAMARDDAPPILAVEIATEGDPRQMQLF